MKHSQLQKLETKIETNLNSHRKTLQFFFRENDNCPTCTQPIDKDLIENKCNHYHTTISKIRERLSQARRITARRESGNKQNLNQDTRHECRNAQDKYITREHKKTCRPNTFRYITTKQ